MRLVVTPQKDIAEWVCARTQIPYREDVTALGFVDEEQHMIAGAAFNEFTGNNIFVHIAVTEPTAFKGLARMIGKYAFEQLGCKRLTLVTEARNLDIVDLHKRLGAVLEGTLKGASRSGDDILISRLDQDCTLWRRLNGRRR